MSNKEMILHPVFLILEFSLFSYSLVPLFWALYNLRLPTIIVPGLWWQDFLTPPDPGVRLSEITLWYTFITIAYVIVVYHPKTRMWLEDGLLWALAFVLRPLKVKAMHNEIKKRFNSLPPLSFENLLSLINWHRQHIYILGGRGLEFSNDLALAGILHIGVTSIFFPEIFEGLFGTGIIGIVLGILLIIFMIRWFLLFWSYWFLMYIRIQAIRGKKSSSKFGIVTHWVVIALLPGWWAGYLILA